MAACCPGSQPSRRVETTGKGAVATPPHPGASPVERGKGEEEAATPLSGPGWPAGGRDPPGPSFSLSHGRQPGVAPSPVFGLSLLPIA